MVYESYIQMVIFLFIKRWNAIAFFSFLIAIAWISYMCQALFLVLYKCCHSMSFKWSPQNEENEMQTILRSHK